MLSTLQCICKSCSSILLPEEEFRTYLRRMRSVLVSTSDSASSRTREPASPFSTILRGTGVYEGLTTPYLNVSDRPLPHLGEGGFMGVLLGAEQLIAWIVSTPPRGMTLIRLPSLS